MPNAMKVMARSGRWAILARVDKSTKWVQVESVSGDVLADNLVEELEENDEKRKEYIVDEIEDQGEDCDWGSDAPEKMPD